MSPKLKPNELILPKQYSGAKLLNDNGLLLHFGAWKQKVRVQYDNHLSQNKIVVSSKISAKYKIPAELPFDIKLTGPNLYIGPVIAFIVERRSQLTPGTLAKYENYFKQIKNMNGLIYVCSPRGIDTRKKSIKGYYYDPNTGKNESPWKSGTFPYPNAVYRRTSIPHWIFRDLVSVVGKNKIFNTNFMHKYKIAARLVSNPIIQKHMPETIKLAALPSLNNMLMKYSSVYLKPVVGSYARGIVKAEKTVAGYRFIDRSGRETIQNVKQAAQFLRRLNYRRLYIIQRDVALKHKDINVDFRAIMQKNGSKEWSCSGLVARFGGYGQIYTNDTTAIVPGREALMKIFNLNEQQALAKEQEMINISKRACEILDKSSGHFGDLGVDLTVDPNKHVWILEVNNFAPDHKIALYIAGDRKMYAKVVTTPFEYAKSLAGF